MPRDISAEMAAKILGFAHPVLGAAYNLSVHIRRGSVVVWRFDDEAHLVELCAGRLGPEALASLQMAARRTAELRRVVRSNRGDSDNETLNAS